MFNLSTELAFAAFFDNFEDSWKNRENNYERNENCWHFYFVTYFSRQMTS